MNVTQEILYFSQEEFSRYRFLYLPTLSIQNLLPNSTLNLVLLICPLSRSSQEKGRILIFFSFSTLNITHTNLFTIGIVFILPKIYKKEKYY